MNEFKYCVELMKQREVVNVLLGILAILIVAFFAR